MPDEALMNRLERELNRLLGAHDYPPVRFEQLGFVHDSYVNRGEPPSVPASRIRTGANALELLASLAERKPAWIQASFITTHAGHGIVSLLAGASTEAEGTSIKVGLESFPFDLIDDEDTPISYTDAGAAASGTVLGKAEMLDAGERVVELGALCVTTALLSGALSGALSAALLAEGWLVATVSGVGGAAVGFAAGKVTARALFRTGGGYTAVVRAGAASLGSTLRSALAGSLAAACLVTVLAALLFSAVGHPLLLAGVALGVGIGLGVVFACSSALL